MAVDATYQTNVYTERGGNREGAGSGGTIAIESGGSILCADSTTINLVAGAALSMESGAVLGLVGEDIALTDMRAVLASELGAAVEIGTGTTLATESVLATKNLPKNARIVTILGALSASQCSFWLTSVSAGREVWLRVVGDSTGAFGANNTSVAILTSGCILLGSVGGVIASMHMETSANSNTTLHLMAPYDDVWAVVGELGTITES